MKYLKNLPNHNVYESFINSDEFTEIQAEKNNVISFCKQEKHVHYNPYIPPPPPKALDILYSDNNGNLSYTSEILPIYEGKTPIALCIAGTNFFGDNEPARWMSLKYMNYTTPEIGSLSAQNMYWGNGDTNVTTINDIIKTYFNGIDNGYILVDYSDNTSQTNILPDVLTADNKWNISNLGTINQYAMTDIDGKNKTEKILATATGQVDWLTDTTIENSSAANYTPAACCCARYHTLGTQAGDWYLGACGELCQILINKTNINTKLAAISAIYSVDSINSLLNNYLWTSTESGGNIVYRINTTNAYLTCYDYFGKKNNSYVIALLQY